MKIRIFTKSVIDIIFFVAIWCTTPSAANTNLTIKIILTCAIPILYISYCFCKKHHLHLRIRDTARSIKNAFYHSVYILASWIYGIDLNDVHEKCYQLTNNGREPKPLARRIARSLDITALFTAIGIISLGAFLCHYHMTASLIILNLSSITAILVFFIIVDHVTPTFSTATTISTPNDVFAGIIFCIPQFFIPIAQIIAALLNSNQDIASAVAYDPHVSVQLGFTSFTLAPLQTFSIICFVFALISFSTSSIAIQKLIETTPETPQIP